MAQNEPLRPKNIEDNQIWRNYVLEWQNLYHHPKRYYVWNLDYRFDLTLSEKSLYKDKTNHVIPDDVYQKALTQRNELQEQVIKTNKARDIAYGKIQIDNLERTEYRFEGLPPKIYEKRAEILELFGRYFKISEVYYVIAHEWGFKDMRTSYLDEFVKANALKIEELKREYDESIKDIRLGKRVARLDELTWLYHNVKQKYLKHEYREDIKVMQSLLEQIKKEVDGDLVINGKLQIDVEHTINIQLQNEYLKDLNITALVITKLAGRLNINPNFILSRLANSYYAKFTGFAGATRSEMLDDEIFYPSGIAYDWDAIMIKTEENLQIDNKAKRFDNIEEAEVIKFTSIQEMMQEEIAKNNRKLSDLKDNISNQNKPTSI